MRKQTYPGLRVVLAVVLVAERFFRRHAAFESRGELRPLDFTDNREIVAAPKEERPSVVQRGGNDARVKRALNYVDKFGIRYLLS